MSLTPTTAPAKTQKPPLHGQHWVAITGKPLAATAGAITFQKGGNAGRCGLRHDCGDRNDVGRIELGRETQALIYNPNTGKVIGVNALGVAPTGATPEFFRAKGMKYPPEYGPLAAVTPGTPGGIMDHARGVRHLESRARARARHRAWRMATRSSAKLADSDRTQQGRASSEWPESKRILLVHDEARSQRSSEAGEIFRQPDLASDACASWWRPEARALQAGKDRKAARSWRPTNASTAATSPRTSCAGHAKSAGLITQRGPRELESARRRAGARNYKGIEVYKLTTLGSGSGDAAGTEHPREPSTSSRWATTALATSTSLYQAMNLAYADRDFYYGDPYFPPAEPINGLAVEGVRAHPRQAASAADRQRPRHPPRRSVSVPGRDAIRIESLLEHMAQQQMPDTTAQAEFDRHFRLGTTSVEAADDEGWVVSVTPSGGWMPAVIAGKTGIGMSQRMQSFVLDAAENPVQRRRAGQAAARRRSRRRWRSRTASRSSLSPCRAATRRTRTCCSSS